MLRLRSERGATAMIVAGSLMLVMGMAAVALDVGMGFSERRQAQTGADFGALAALQGAGYDSCTGSSCNPVTARNEGAAEAIEVVEANLGKTLDWASCTDPDPLPHQSGTTGCVSFTTNFDEARVHIPDDVIDTTFGRVVGRDTLTIQGEAAAEQRLNQRGNILPFHSDAAASQLCLFTPPRPHAPPPCDGPSQGNFGALDIMLYGNDDLGTTPSCSGNGGTRLRSNIRLGVDHNLVVRGSNPQVSDPGACPNRSADVNALETLPGVASASRDDLDAGFTARLASACPGSGASVRGACFDDTPLWAFLAPGACTSTPVDRDDMESCLASWTPGTVIFSEDIVEHVRFARIPLLSNTGTGRYLGNIAGFQTIYLESIYIECGGSGPCSTVFSPGEGTPIPSCGDPNDSNCGHSGGQPLSRPNVSVEMVTAFSLDLGMLPASVRDQLAGSAGTREMLLYE